MEPIVKTNLMLAAPANIFGRSLRTFLGTMSEVELIISTETPDQVGLLLRENKPDVLILDADLIDQNKNLNLGAFLEELEKSGELKQMIVLVGSTTQQHVAKKHPSVKVLVKGELGEQLREAIQLSMNYQKLRFGFSSVEG